MTRRLIALAALFLFALPLAHADEASKRVKLEEMFTVLKMDRTMKQLMNQGFSQTQLMVKTVLGGEKPITPADQKIVDDYVSKSTAIITDTLSWDKFKPAYLDLYASAYTESEVDGILAFYKSPVGQSVLSKGPELITHSSQMVTARLQELQPHMRELMTTFKSQIEAAHAAKPAAAPAPATTPSKP
jgi:uncharacterized protein